MAKVNCATCHQGVYKPLYGAPMAKDYPALLTLGAPSDGLPAPLAEAHALGAVFRRRLGQRWKPTRPKGSRPLIATLKATARSRATISGYHSAR